MQYLLRARGFDIEADGFYGPITGEAVRQFDGANRSFQEMFGLVADGTVGPATWHLLVVPKSE